MSNLKIPFAFDIKRNLVRAKEAEKGQRYFCPGCDAQVMLKKGVVNAAHYAHKDSDICTQEQIIRGAAKYCVQNAVNEWKNGSLPQPVLVRKCQACWERVVQNIPDKVDVAERDFMLDGDQVDVALIAAGKVLAAIVIDIEQTLNEYSEPLHDIPYITVDGWKVIENPSIWQAELDAFRLVVCEKCQDRFRQYQERASRVALKTGIEIPPSYYRYGITHCWKCNAEIIVFTWPESGHQTMGRPKKEPIPRTIQYRFSKTAGHKYWANTCPRCGMIQGSFYLHSEPGAPFFCVYCEADTAESYQADMYKIAYYADKLRTAANPA